MNKERDLLPWIFGGLSAAALAVAFAAVSTHRAEATFAPPASATRASVAPAQPALATSPPPGLAPAAAPAAQIDSASNAAPPAQAPLAPEVQAGQIWECTTQGVKTFSNNPCGEKSTLLEVGPINSMSPLSTVHYARAYGPDPRYAAGYPDQSASSDAEDYSDQYGADTGGNSYTIVGVVARRRPEQIHRSPPPPSHHNPAPVRRY